MNAKTSNVVEYIRERAVDSLFGMKTMANSWSTWRNEIHGLTNPQQIAASEILDLGNHLGSIFRSTGDSENEADENSARTQSSLSGGGAAWEGLVCWYLNLCMLGTRCVVIKQSKSLVPAPISDALTVMYGSIPSNTESDLIAITFPDELTKITKRFSKDAEYKVFIDDYARKSFSEIEVCVVQCKTNWNDNAQVPMLWDIIYSSAGFASRASVGRNGYLISSLKRFAYAFATVPSNKRTKYEHNSVAVLRVKALSGCNFWGQETKTDVALSLAEMPNKNFATAMGSCVSDWHSSQGSLYRKLRTDYKYFRFFDETEHYDYNQDDLPY